MTEVEKKIMQEIFADIKKGKFPDFGSPETKCEKCMFYKTVCFQSAEYVGCLGGWKRGKTNDL